MDVTQTLACTPLFPFTLSLSKGLRSFANGFDPSKRFGWLERESASVILET